MELLKSSTPEVNETRKYVSTKCGICGDPHFYRDCKYVILSSKVRDKEISTRAKLSLPDVLEIKKLADESFSVFTKSMVELGTEFGPFIAKKNLTLNPFTIFPIKLFIENESDLSEYYLDTTDENECCWMMFVNPASDVEEQNLICYQEGEDVFFGSIRDIHPGEELKVWYSPYYAFKMQKSTLSFKDISKLQVESEIQKNETDDLNTLIKEQQKIVPRVVWNCKFCYKLEKRVTDFARHLMSHYSLHKRKTCEHCDQRFQYIQDYRKHLKLHHKDSSDKDDMSSKCLQVPNKVESNKPLIGLKSNTVGGPLLLQFSNDSLDNSNSLMAQTEANLFEIENYDNQNIVLDGENLHLNVDIIGNHSIKDLEDFNSDVKTKELEKKQEFICDICLRKFTTLKAISVHLKLHIGKYFCSSCKKVFGRLENLKQHKCNQVYSLKCPKCEKIFNQQKYLVKHMSVVHDKRHVCSVCKNFYYSSFELKNHVCKKVPQEKRRQLTCQLCMKKFANEIYLRKHMKTHSTVKEKSQAAKYICSECSCIFSSKLIYIRHLMYVHNKVQDFICQICDKSFSRKDVLTSHLRNIHMLGENKDKDNRCEKCNKEFKTTRSLKCHLSTHNDMQYKCGCGDVFKYLRNLSKHLKTKRHTRKMGIVPDGMHQCPICSSNMKLKTSLKRHIRKQHPGEYKNICVKLNAKKEEKKKLTQKCPICQHEGKSLERHILKNHPKDYKYICKDFTKKAMDKQNKDTKIHDEDFDNYIDTDQKCMDLQKTIENMDFNIDSCNDNLFSGSETIDKFLKESSEQMSFTNSPKSSNLNDSGMTLITDRISNRDLCLSMPDLSEMDHEIRLGKTSTVPVTDNVPKLQEDADNVVVYVLKEN